MNAFKFAWQIYLPTKNWLLVVVFLAISAKAAAEMQRRSAANRRRAEQVAERERQVAERRQPQPPPPSSPVGVGGSRGLAPSPKPTEPKETITKSEIIQELQTTSKDLFAPHFASLAEQTKGIDLTGRYTYTTRTGKEYDVSGRGVRAFLGVERIGLFRERAAHKLETSKSIEEIKGFPTGTTFTRTNGAFNVNIPESAQLEWSEHFLGETQELPPVASEVSRFGFGLVSSMASVVKPVAGLFGLEKEFGMAMTLGTSTAIHPYDPTGTVKGFATGLTKTRYGIHYVSPMDIAFEPIGWSPKGSSELARSDPWFLAGGIGGEIAQTIAITAAMRPVGKGIRWAGGRVVTSPPVKKGISKVFDIGERATAKIGQTSPYLQRHLRYPIKQLVTTSPKRFGLKGAMVSTAELTGTRLSGRIGYGLQRFGERTGFSKYIGISGEAVYTKPLFASKDIWVHAGSKTYQNLLKGMTKGAGALAFDPISRQLVLTAKKLSLSKPIGFLGRKIKATKDIFGVGYSYVDEPIRYPILRSDVWRTGGRVLTPDEVFLGKGYTPQWLSSKLGGTGRMGTNLGKVQPFYKGNIITKLDDITRGFHTGGFAERISMTRGEQQLLRFLEAAEPVYKPVSKIMPAELFKRFPKTIMIPTRSFSKVFTPGVFSAAAVGLAKSGSAIFRTLTKDIPKKRISLKSDFQIGILKSGFDFGLRYSIRKDVAPALRFGSITTPILSQFFKTGQQLKQDVTYKQSMKQLSILESASLQRSTTRAKTGFPLPIFPKIPLYGRGKKFYDKEYWRKRFLYREFFVPTLGETSDVITKAAFKGINLKGSKKKTKKKKTKRR